MRRISFALVVLLAACTESPFLPWRDHTTDVTLSTQEEIYNASPLPGASVTVRFDLTNHTREPIQVALCGDSPPAEVQQFQHGEWVTVYSGICHTLVATVPVTLAPGASLPGEAVVSGVYGTFRLRLDYLRGELAPLGSAVSPSFSIRNSSY
jgi:hypothetical protein